MSPIIIVSSSSVIRITIIIFISLLLITLASSSPFYSVTAQQQDPTTIIIQEENITKIHFPDMEKWCLPKNLYEANGNSFDGMYEDRILQNIETSNATMIEIGNSFVSCDNGVVFVRNILTGGFVIASSFYNNATIIFENVSFQSNSPKQMKIEVEETFDDSSIIIQNCPNITVSNQVRSEVNEEIEKYLMLVSARKRLTNTNITIQNVNVEFETAAFMHLVNLGSWGASVDGGELTIVDSSFSFKKCGMKASLFTFGVHDNSVEHNSGFNRITVENNRIRMTGHMWTTSFSTRSLLTLEGSENLRLVVRNNSYSASYPLECYNYPGRASGLCPRNLGRTTANMVNLTRWDHENVQSVTFEDNLLEIGSHIFTATLVTVDSAFNFNGDQFKYVNNTLLASRDAGIREVNLNFYYSFLFFVSLSFAAPVTFSASSSSSSSSSSLVLVENNTILDLVTYRRYDENRAYDPVYRCQPTEVVPRWKPSSNFTVFLIQSGATFNHTQVVLRKNRVLSDELSLNEPLRLKYDGWCDVVQFGILQTYAQDGPLLFDNGSSLLFDHNVLSIFAEVHTITALEWLVSPTHPISFSNNNNNNNNSLDQQHYPYRSTGLQIFFNNRFNASILDENNNNHDNHDFWWLHDESILSLILKETSSVDHQIENNLRPRNFTTSAKIYGLIVRVFNETVHEHGGSFRFHDYHSPLLMEDMNIVVADKSQLPIKELIVDVLHSAADLVNRPFVQDGNNNNNNNNNNNAYQHPTQESSFSIASSLIVRNISLSVINSIVRQSVEYSDDQVGFRNLILRIVTGGNLPIAIRDQVLFEGSSILAAFSLVEISEELRKINNQDPDVAARNLSADHGSFQASTVGLKLYLNSQFSRFGNDVQQVTARNLDIRLLGNYHHGSDSTSSSADSDFGVIPFPIRFHDVCTCDFSAPTEQSVTSFASTNISVLIHSISVTSASTTLKSSASLVRSLFTTNQLIVSDSSIDLIHCVFVIIPDTFFNHGIVALDAASLRFFSISNLRINAVNSTVSSVSFLLLKFVVKVLPLEQLASLSTPSSPSTANDPLGYRFELANSSVNIQGVSVASRLLAPPSASSSSSSSIRDQLLINYLRRKILDNATVHSVLPENYLDAVADALETLAVQQQDGSSSESEFLDGNNIGIVPYFIRSIVGSFRAINTVFKRGITSSASGSSQIKFVEKFTKYRRWPVGASAFLSSYGPQSEILFRFINNSATVHAFEHDASFLSARRTGWHVEAFNLPFASDVFPSDFSAVNFHFENNIIDLSATTQQPLFPSSPSLTQQFVDSPRLNQFIFNDTSVQLVLMTSFPSLYSELGGFKSRFWNSSSIVVHNNSIVCPSCTAQLSTAVSSFDFLQISSTYAFAFNGAVVSSNLMNITLVQFDLNDPDDDYLDMVYYSKNLRKSFIYLSRVYFTSSFVASSNIMQMAMQAALSSSSSLSSSKDNNNKNTSVIVRSIELAFLQVSSTAHFLVPPAKLLGMVATRKSTMTITSNIMSFDIQQHLNLKILQGCTIRFFDGIIQPSLYNLAIIRNLFFPDGSGASSSSGRSLLTISNNTLHRRNTASLSSNTILLSEQSSFSPSTSPHRFDFNFFSVSDVDLENVVLNSSSSSSSSSSFSIFSLSNNTFAPQNFNIITSQATVRRVAFSFVSLGQSPTGNYFLSAAATDSSSKHNNNNNNNNMYDKTSLYFANVINNIFSVTNVSISFRKKKVIDENTYQGILISSDRGVIALLYFEALRTGEDNSTEGKIMVSPAYVSSNRMNVVISPEINNNNNNHDYLDLDLDLPSFAISVLLAQSFPSPAAFIFDFTYQTPSFSHLKVRDTNLEVMIVKPSTNDINDDASNSLSSISAFQLRLRPGVPVEDGRPGFLAAVSEENSFENVTVQVSLSSDGNNAPKIHLILVRSDDLPTVNGSQLITNRSAIVFNSEGNKADFFEINISNSRIIATSSSPSPASSSSVDLFSSWNVPRPIDFHLNAINNNVHSSSSSSSSISLASLRYSDSSSSLDRKVNEPLFSGNLKFLNNEISAPATTSSISSSFSFLQNHAEFFNGTIDFVGNSVFDENTAIKKSLVEVLQNTPCFGSLTNVNFERNKLSSSNTYNEGKAIIVRHHTDDDDDSNLFVDDANLLASFINVTNSSWKVHCNTKLAPLELQRFKTLLSHSTSFVDEISFRCTETPSLSFSDGNSTATTSESTSVSHSDLSSTRTYIRPPTNTTTNSRSKSSSQKTRSFSDENPSLSPSALTPSSSLSETVHEPYVRSRKLAEIIPAGAKASLSVVAAVVGAPSSFQFALKMTAMTKLSECGKESSSQENTEGKKDPALSPLSFDSNLLMIEIGGGSTDDENNNDNDDDEPFLPQYVGSLLGNSLVLLIAMILALVIIKITSTTKLPTRSFSVSCVKAGFPANPVADFMLVLGPPTIASMVSLLSISSGRSFGVYILSIVVIVLFLVIPCGNLVRIQSMVLPIETDEKESKRKKRKERSRSKRKNDKNNQSSSALIGLVKVNEDDNVRGDSSDEGSIARSESKNPMKTALNFLTEKKLEWAALDVEKFEKKKRERSKKRRQNLRSLMAGENDDDDEDENNSDFEDQSDPTKVFSKGTIFFKRNQNFFDFFSSVWFSLFHYLIAVILASISSFSSVCTHKSCCDATIIITIALALFHFCAMIFIRPLLTRLDQTLETIASFMVLLFAAFVAIIQFGTSETAGTFTATLSPLLVAAMGFAYVQMLATFFPFAYKALKSIKRFCGRRKSRRDKHQKKKSRNNSSKHKKNDNVNSKKEKGNSDKKRKEEKADERKPSARNHHHHEEQEMSPRNSSSRRTTTAANVRSLAQLNDDDNDNDQNQALLFGEADDRRRNTRHSPREAEKISSSKSKRETQKSRNEDRRTNHSDNNDKSKSNRR